MLCFSTLMSAGTAAQQNDNGAEDRDEEDGQDDEGEGANAEADFDRQMRSELLRVSSGGVLCLILVFHSWHNRLPDFWVLSSLFLISLIMFSFSRLICAP